MRPDDRETDPRRMRNNIKPHPQLCDLGLLDADDATVDRLVAHLALIAKFWLPEYRTTFEHWPIGDAIGHDLSLIARPQMG